VPVDTVMVAAPPTVASGDAASTVIVSVRFTSVPDTEGRDGAELGDVLLPPHAGTATPSASSDTAWHVRAQNSRRVEPSAAEWSE
jgi:hypothetical protein